MTALLKFFIGPIAGPLFGIIALGALIGNAVQWGVWSWRISLIEADRDSYKERIENPDTGYTRQVTQCLTNTTGLREAIADVDKNAKDREDGDKARDEGLQKSMAATAKQAKGALDNSALILARPTVTTPGTLASCSAGEKYLRGALP